MFIETRSMIASLSGLEKGKGLPDLAVVYRTAPVGSASRAYVELGFPREPTLCEIGES